VTVEIHQHGAVADRLCGADLGFKFDQTRRGLGDEIGGCGENVLYVHTLYSAPRSFSLTRFSAGFTADLNPRADARKRTSPRLGSAEREVQSEPERPAWTEQPTHPSARFRHAATAS